MAHLYPRIDERLTAWMADQPVFFVATAPDDPEGLINCSPKGNRREFAVIDEHTVAYLDQTGSGVETVAHLRDNGRIVVMFCAFCGPPRIVRLHGHGHATFPGDAEFVTVAGAFPGAEGIGVRSVVVVDVTRVADSCGYGVPLMDFDQHRPTMSKWAARKGPEGIRDYWAEKNRSSIDGLDGLPLPS
ncbi:MAG: pyridoxamine 5'-phosphate oxidase family protein [Actinomycetota bacterium]|nr:pyridoxamine 5'-phosphate oxidase family protein [Actinomycetota bacterium]